MNPVIKSASYILVHTPDMVIHNGTTAAIERITTPDSEFLKKLPESLRSFEDCVNYAPNQVYIGNMAPEALRDIPEPWCNTKVEGQRFGKYGEIMPEDEFIALVKIVDAFDLVHLTKEFTASIKEKLAKHPLINENDIALLKEGDDKETVQKLVDEQHSEPLIYNNELVGCVKRAHDIDLNLTAHTMLENLVVKASGVLAARNIVSKCGLEKNAIEYVIECSEEACGDMNQRGGGNFAKAIAEGADLQNATGADMRGFCAGPTHSLIAAASLVKAGVYKNVMVVAGGATAKLGMNGKSHVEKGLPILEDVLGGFAIIVGEDDGKSPIINLDLTGRHTVGTGSSPQAVITSLVVNALDKGGLKITDIDKYSPEMQNPDITKPAGAGDVPASNYKMIGALGVKRGELTKPELANFATQYGLPGFAPTQGHIPSGVPSIGYAIDEMTAGKINRMMIIGKGSLFLGRMTNLFDGVSFVMEANKGQGSQKEEAGFDEAKVRSIIAESMRKLAEDMAK